MFMHFSHVWEFTLPPYLFGFTINYLLTLAPQSSVYLCIMYKIKYIQLSRISCQQIFKVTWFAIHLYYGFSSYSTNPRAEILKLLVVVVQTSHPLTYSTCSEGWGAQLQCKPWPQAAPGGSSHFHSGQSPVKTIPFKSLENHPTIKCGAPAWTKWAKSQTLTAGIWFHRNTLNPFQGA